MMKIVIVKKITKNKRSVINIKNIKNSRNLHLQMMVLIAPKINFQINKKKNKAVVRKYNR